MSAGNLGAAPMQAAVVDRVDSPPLGVPGAAYVESPAVDVDVTQVPLRDRVRWGPIVAGVVTAFAVLLFLTVLGLALGISTLGRDNASEWGTAAGIWGGLTLLIAFFLGGWMAARSATTIADADGPLNGFIAGAATLLLLLWLATTALTGALGFFTSTIADIAGASAPVAVEAINNGAVPADQNAQQAVNQAVENPQAAVPPEAQQAAQQAAQTASRAAGPGAWGTTIAIFLAVAAATLGGMVGKNRDGALLGPRTIVRRS